MFDFNLNYSKASQFTWPADGEKPSISFMPMIQVVAMGDARFFPPEANIPELSEVINYFHFNIGIIQALLVLPPSVMELKFDEEPMSNHHLSDSQILDKLSSANFTQWPNVKFGLYAILCSSLIYSWTAFESLATDLWVKAVDLRPRTLGKNMAALESTKGENSNTKAAKNEKKLPFADLSLFDFNLSGSVGKILKESELVKFTSLHSIKTAYFDAFRYPSSAGSTDYKIYNSIYHIFESSYSILSCHESIRNLLAHRGGIIDKKFRSETELYDKSLSEYKNNVGNARIAIDGEMVLKHIRNVIDTSLRLLKAVGSWLAKTQNDVQYIP